MGTERANTAEAFTRQYGQGDLRKYCEIGLGEVAQWCNRGIISAPTCTGRGNHRAVSFWNLLEAKVAKSLSVNLGMPASHLEAVMQEIRDRIAEIGTPDSFPLKSIYMGDWSIRIHPQGKTSRVLLRFGSINDDNIFPVIAMVNLSAIAQELLDSITEDETGSQNWYHNAVDVRRSRGDGIKLPICENVFSREQHLRK